MLTKIISEIHFIIWRKIHTLPEYFIEIWQISEFKKITWHAFLNSDLYHNLYEKQKINFNTIKTKKDIEKIPIITKKIFQKTTEENYLCLEKPRNCYRRHTSGTTGEQFSFYVTRNWLDPHMYFLNFRALFWEGNSIEKIKKMSYINLDINHDDYKYPQLNRIKISANEVEKNTKKTLKEIFDFRPEIIDGFPSFIIDYTKQLIRYPQYNNKLKYIISRGEKLTAGQKKYIEKNLKCNIYNRYGMEEFGVIGIECRYHNGFHINTESFLLEIVNDEGKNVEIGKSGNIVITDFRNYVMPFIRYKTGDCGYYIKEKCKCGLPDNKLTLVGRDVEFLKLGNKQIHHFEFYDIFKFYSDIILQYQIVHTESNKIDIFIVIINKINDYDINTIISEIKKIIGHNYYVKINITDKITKTSRGKIRTIINLEENIKG
jgi:phenylacetate-CoA ligase